MNPRLFTINSRGFYSKTDRIGM